MKVDCPNVSGPCLTLELTVNHDTEMVSTLSIPDLRHLVETMGRKGISSTIAGCITPSQAHEIAGWFTDDTFDVGETTVLSRFTTMYRKPKVA